MDIRMKLDIHVVHCKYNVLTMDNMEKYYIVKEGVVIMANLTMRIDDELKKQAEELFNELGMNMTTAFTIFAIQAVREQRIPFEITRDVPNAEALEEISEVEQMKKDSSLGKSYTDVDEMMKELLA